MKYGEYFELKSQGMFKDTDFVPVSWVKILLLEWGNLCSNSTLDKVNDEVSKTSLHVSVKEVIYQTIQMMKV